CRSAASSSRGSPQRGACRSSSDAPSAPTPPAPCLLSSPNHLLERIEPARRRAREEAKRDPLHRTPPREDLCRRTGCFLSLAIGLASYALTGSACSSNSSTIPRV